MGSRVMLVFAPQGRRAPTASRGPTRRIPAGTVIVRAAGGGRRAAARRRHRARPRARRRAPGRGAQGQDRRQGRGEVHRPRRQARVGLPRRGAQGRPALRRQAVQAAGEHGRARHHRRAAGVQGRRRRCASGRARTSSSRSPTTSCRWPRCWRLMNTSSMAVDPGPNGLHLPLAEHALSAQGGPQNPPNVTVAGHEAVIKGPIAPGDTEIQVVFALAYDGALARLRAAHADPVRRRGDGDREDRRAHRRRQSALQSEDRELQGRKLVLYRGPGTSPGGTVELHLRGLPHNDPTWRYLAAGIAIVLPGRVRPLRGARQRRQGLARAARAAARAPPRRAGRAREEPTAATSASARSRS